MTIAYDGVEFAGWQVQPGRRTIQGELERAFLKFAGVPVKAHGSSRTDQGVHAAALVAHVELTRKWPPLVMLKALNAYLPADIRILKVKPVAADFHARRSAKAKEYRYFIWNAEIMPPWLRMYRVHIKKPLDIVAMRKAAACLVGRHDFAAFTANPRREVKSTVRTLIKLEIKASGKEVVVIARGDGFLYKMVRGLVGFLLRVGAGELTPADARKILCSRERTSRVPTAPPEGLFLWRVFY